MSGGNAALIRYLTTWRYAPTITKPINSSLPGKIPESNIDPFSIGCQLWYHLRMDSGSERGFTCTIECWVTWTFCTSSNWITYDGVTGTTCISPVHNMHASTSGLGFSELRSRNGINISAFVSRAEGKGSRVSIEVSIAHLQQCSLRFQCMQDARVILM